MEPRIQQVLDGDLTRGALTQEEQIELAEAERLIKGVLASIPMEPLPDLSSAVLDRAAPARKKPWLWRPTTITLRPAYVLAAAAVLAFVLLIPHKQQRPALAQVLIQFKLDAPTARNVSLAGDFTQWK